jgi:nucleoside 2-deoxyribosyltransferase
MMKAYIAVSYSKKSLYEPVLQAIAGVLRNEGIKTFVFVDEYTFTDQQESAMMQQAMKDIDACDLVIAETSDKAIGIGVEAGYAKAKNKPVIYLRQQNAAHSSTVAGISDFQVIYNGTDDLQEQLSGVLTEILNRK